MQPKPPPTFLWSSSEMKQLDIVCRNVSSIMKLLNINLPNFMNRKICCEKKIVVGNNSHPHLFFPIKSSFSVYQGGTHLQNCFWGSKLKGSRSSKGTLLACHQKKQFLRWQMLTSKTVFFGSALPRSPSLTLKGK